MGGWTDRWTDKHTGGEMEGEKERIYFCSKSDKNLSMPDTKKIFKTTKQMV